MMTAGPKAIHAKRETATLDVTWGDESLVRYPFRFLRGECSCAQCVDEFTGVRTLDPASIATDIAVESMELVGSYALRIRWSDGHDTGLYTWERLRGLAADVGG